MNVVVSFLPEASAEAEGVIGDCRARLPGFRLRFAAELETACAAIAENHRLWRLRPEGFRRVDLAGFPYYVAFVVEDERGLLLLWLTQSVIRNTS